MDRLSTRSIVPATMALALSACSGGTPKHHASEPPGSLSLRLNIGGLTVNSVSLTIESEMLDPPVVRQRTIDVADANATVSASEAGLPPGSYALRLAATPVDDPATSLDESTIPCTGSVSGVNVQPARVTQVDNLVLVCTLDGGLTQVAGGIRIQAGVAIDGGSSCGAVIDELFIGAQRTSVGTSVDLVAVVSSGVTGAWSASGGSIADPSAASTTFTCPSSAGSYELTYSATRGASCSEQITRSVLCVGAGGESDAGNAVDAGPGSDAGSAPDAGAEADAGGDSGATLDASTSDAQTEVDASAEVDAGTQLDSGAQVDAGGESDSGAQADAGSDAGGNDPGTLAQRCEACIQDARQEQAYRDFNAACNQDPLCVAAKQCLINDTSVGGKSCFDATPAVCYCGAPNPTTGFDDCEFNASFTPNGPCAEVLIAGAGADARRLDVLYRLSDARFATGQAYLIVDEATRVCASECGFTP